jgi:glyoxylase-like metal-dependent hydrolase (beta-lactamase superfamily II)
MFERIKPNIYKFSYSSNFYYYKDLQLLIDCGAEQDRNTIITDFNKLNLDFKKIKYIIFTHLHYDHIGNYKLFENARFYASQVSINDLKNSAYDTVLDLELSKKITSIKLYNLKEKEFINSIFTIIETPGHTKGSICLFDKENKILYSGDTLFYNQVIGRYDLPTSSPLSYNISLKRLSKLDFKILCPGHDY